MLNTNNSENGLKEKYSEKTITRFSAQKDSLSQEQLYNYAVSLFSSIYPSPEKQKEGISVLKKLFDNGNAAAGMYLANVYF